MSLTFARASGIPMIVRPRAMPVTMWPRTSHHPHSTTHRTLPIADAAPASGRCTTVRPNGHRANTAIRSAAIPNGIVMMRMKQIAAAIA